MRTLRNNILLADFDRRLRVILVTSPSPSEGKSTVAAHLAIAHAEQGRKTLLIDGDLRRPSIHRKFDFTPSSGLSSVLLNGVVSRRFCSNRTRRARHSGGRSAFTARLRPDRIEHHRAARADIAGV